MTCQTHFSLASASFLVIRPILIWSICQLSIMIQDLLRPSRSHLSHTATKTTIIRRLKRIKGIADTIVSETWDFSHRYQLKSSKLCRQVSPKQTSRPPRMMEPKTRSNKESRQLISDSVLQSMKQACAVYRPAQNGALKLFATRIMNQSKNSLESSSIRL